MIKELTLNANDTIILHSDNENVKGADIEWWILDKEKNAFVLRIQAKRLYRHNRKGHSYDEIGHPKGKRVKKQIENLIEESIKDGMIPLYCFYNFIQGAETPEDNGWTFGYAHEIKDLMLNSVGDLEFNKENIKYVHINPKCNPMHKLASDLLFKPKEEILDKIVTITKLEESHFLKKEVASYVKTALKEFEIARKNIREFEKHILSYNEVGLQSKPNSKYLIITKTKELFGT